MFSRLLRLPHYVKIWGIKGIAVFWLIEVSARRARGTTTVRSGFLPKAFHPISVRPTASDCSFVWQVLVRREYEMHDFAQIERIERRYREESLTGRQPLIIDCGGNIGLAAIWFAVQFPLAVIYSIEPDAENFAMLQQNCRHYPNIVPVHGAIWSHPAQVTIENPGAGAGAFRVCESTDNTDPHNVRAYTIDEIREQSGNTGILIVKVDIEGGEKNLFGSNTSWVSNTGLIVAELHDWLYPWAGTSKPFFACMSKQDVSYMFRGENIFCFQH